MLFRTVYGSELEAIYTAISIRYQGGLVSRASVIDLFVPTINGALTPTQNVEDALSFLISAQVIRETPNGFHPVQSPLPFRLFLLNQLRRLALGQLEPHHPQDPLYLMLYDSLFVTPDVTFVADLHSAANQISRVQQLGGLGREKVQAWKRIMAYLGLGYRAFDGFLAVVNPRLAQDILDHWGQDSATLDQFFERHWARFLPFRARTGDAAQAIQQSLLYLMKRNKLSLTALQDSPSRAYFLPQRMRAIRREHTHV